MPRTLRTLVVGLVLLATALVAQAADLELYVKNRPFTGSTVTRGGQLHAELGALLQALGFSWTVQGDQVAISRTAGGGPSLPGGNLQLALDAKPLAVQVLEIQGMPFVSLADLARAAGLSYRPSPQLGTADLNIPVTRAQIAASAPRTPADSSASATSPAGDGAVADAGQTPAAGGAAVMIETDGTNRKSPIQILKTDFMDTTTAGAQFVGEVRTSTSIRNGSDRPLEKVTLYLRLMNLANEVVQEWKYPIGTMKPGAQVDFTPEPPVWYNYNKIQVTPKVIVEHQAQPEPQPEQPTAPGGQNPPQTGDGR